MNASELDILFVGHAIEDTIFESRIMPYKRWGGIYNCFRAAQVLEAKMAFGPNTKINTECEACSFGEALIVIDRDSCSKNVSANINKHFFDPNYRPAKWTHLLYSNELNFWGDIEKQRGIKSTDLCAGNCPVLLDEFDYVFLSDDEFNPARESKLFSQPKFIAHNPNSVSIWRNGKEIFRHGVPNVLSRCNPLGAGDFFATSFIAHKLFEAGSDGYAAEFAVKMTHQFLLSN